MARVHNTENFDDLAKNRQSASIVSDPTAKYGSLGAAAIIEAPTQATWDALKIISGQDLMPSHKLRAREKTSNRVLKNLDKVAQNARRSNDQVG